MKKIILSIITMIAGLSQAQVIISNQASPTPTNSSVLLEFGNNENKGIILPSVSEVTNPVAGTFAVNTTAKAVQYYDGTAWVNLTYPDVLVENSFINDGTADTGEGVVIGAATSTKPGVLVLESTTQAMVLPHVADPHLNVLSPVAGTIVYDTTSDALAVYDGKEWSYWAAQATPPTNAPGAGTLAGRACFDVVEINDGGDCGTLASRVTQKANFSQTTTNTQTYTFTPTGTVSNVRFMYINSNGQVIQSITPDADYSGTLTNPQTASATVVYYDNLNAAATGLSREDAMTGDIYVVYNNSANNTGTDLQLKLTAKVQDCNCCGAMTFANPDGTGGVVWQEFMCHNMGANIAADPFVPAAAIHGAKYRWGIATGDITGYISQAQDQASPNNPSGYLSTTNEPNGSWTESKGPNDPCPAGYRVPSRAEWEGVAANNTLTRKGSFFESTSNYSSGVMVGDHLFLPAAGSRYNILRNRGLWAGYWSSTEGNSTGASALFFGNTSFQVISNDGNSQRYVGHSVRCIAQ